MSFISNSTQLNCTILLPANYLVAKQIEEKDIVKSNFFSSDILFKIGTYLLTYRYDLRNFLLASKKFMAIKPCFIEIYTQANFIIAIKKVSKIGRINNWLTVLDFLKINNSQKSPLIDPSIDSDFLIRRASKKGQLEVVKELLKDPRVNPAANENEAICGASYYGHLAVVQELLKHIIVKKVNYNKAIYKASLWGHLEIVQEFLKDNKVSLLGFYKVMCNACMYGHLELVKELLNYKKKKGLDLVSFVTEIDTVQNFFRDMRSHPFSHNYLNFLRDVIEDSLDNEEFKKNLKEDLKKIENFYKASIIRKETDCLGCWDLQVHWSFIKIVDNYHNPICLASKYGHLEVLQELLKDKTAYTFDHYKLAMRLAKKYDHLEIMTELLKSDECKVLAQSVDDHESSFFSACF